MEVRRKESFIEIFLCGSWFVFSELASIELRDKLSELLKDNQQDIIQNKSEEEILSLINLKKENFGRFRGCWIEDNKIIVRTRLGGGNRQDEEYLLIINKLRKHHNYLSDKDDGFDCTYANFEFQQDLKHAQNENEHAHHTNCPLDKEGATEE